MLLEDIRLNLKFAEERKVNTDVHLVGNFPTYVRVGDVTLLDTAYTDDTCTKGWIIGSGNIMDITEIYETAVTSDIVITHKAP